MEHWRGLPRHEATDPIKDPRWNSPPKHLTFKCHEVTTEVWLYATDEELADTGIVPPLHGPEGFHIYMMHRTDGPALQRRDENGDVEELWVRYGRLHRENGPAHIYHEVEGYPRWYVNGVRQLQED